MTPEELAAIRERDATWPREELSNSQLYRDRRALLAHIDALEKRIESMAQMMTKDGTETWTSSHD